MRNRSILIGMAILGIAVTAIIAPRFWVAQVRAATNPVSPTDLKGQILKIYEKSAAECDVSYRGQESCIKAQFSLNYRYFILKDQPSSAGAPGVPGPTSGLRPGQPLPIGQRMPGRVARHFAEKAAGG